MPNKTDQPDTVESVVNEARQDYAFALRGCGEKVGHYLNRIKKAHDDEVSELRKCLNESVDAIEAVCEQMGLSESLKRQPDYQQWIKVLGENRKYA